MHRRVIIPNFGGEVAPCFDVASSLTIFTLDGDKTIEVNTIACSSPSGINNVRCVLKEEVDVLICGGINQRFREMLTANGVEVISRISGAVEGALKAYLAGELAGPDEDPVFKFMETDPSLADMVRWSMDLFNAHGFKVRSGAESATFPIDLIAEIRCPICGKSICAAICCGKHFYRVDEEIRAFYYAAGANYNAKIYIHSQKEDIERICREFEIQLLDPEKQAAANNLQKGRLIPIIEPPVAGHDKLT